MCLAVVGKVEKIEGELAIVDLGGVLQPVSLVMVPQVQVGDFVLIHTGYAVEIISEEAYNETMELLKELRWE
ncbi:HypC/HybG/HupF family hydrogenase formation chaperone [Carboxydothermus pertinax]|uniref:Hydrogenase assembly protein HypC n=1 Tax=Carboxydothermus pertinax TaxID=870242 RepID=A0A1L8CY26_9THEO|nr:HypC/HybG/HupF family hydrogenase formation chaperone [Carboxydothermus pertinax]GAV23781.1 hydrogenase assembly protein HypC [Carboxydothermus pertinax]